MPSGFLASRCLIRYPRVRPVSMISSTISTCLPVIDSSKSFKTAVKVAKAVMIVFVWITAFVIFYVGYIQYAIRMMGEF